MTWKKEVAHDILALGSVPFYLIVMARALIGPYWEFLAELVVALAVLAALSYFIRGHGHIARGLVLAILVSVFYKDMSFAIFAFVLYGLMLAGAHVLGIRHKRIRNGALAGAIAAAFALGVAF